MLMNRILLSRPKHGWTTFCLCDKPYNLSYLTCLPIDWLNAAIQGLEQLTPFAVHGFCEPGRFLCIVSYWNCHIIVEDDDESPLVEDEIEREVIHVSMIDFCKMLHENIKKNIDAWCNWDNRNNENTLKEMKIQIDILLNKLYELIIKQEEHFGPNRFFC